MKIYKITETAEYPGHRACRVTTAGCNFRCPLCTHHELLEEPDRQYFTAVDFYSFIEAVPGKYNGVVIDGGEPMLQQELPDFLRHLKGYYGLDIMVYTNGSNYKMLDELLCEGLVDRIVISIKTGRSGYERHTGTKFDEEILENLKKTAVFLTNSYINLPYEFTVTAAGGLYTNEDMAEIGEMIKGAKCFKIKNFNKKNNILLKNSEFYKLSEIELSKFKEIVENLLIKWKSLDISGNSINLALVVFNLVSDIKTISDIKTASDIR
ncbi:MAG: radical SAM protein [Eubacteriales bacterium]|nr:radical SAM protein [Eubacteriales bacterium]